MKQFGRSLLVLCAAVLAVAAVAFASYDILVFQSRKQAIAALLADAAPEERALPAPVAQLMEVSLGGRVSAHASGVLVRELNVPWLLKGMLGWHVTSGLWWACTAIHLSHEQQLTIIASRAHTGGYPSGYAAEAERRFGHRLYELGVAEAATVVASSWEPSENSTPALQARRDRLLSKLGRGT